MKVLVVINNYNYAQYIAEAIESVLGQTYTNYKLLIVDDGSTDQSVEIIEKYASDHPDTIISLIKENGGQGSAFNAAFRYSDGFDVITFLDADDYLFPHKLQEIISYHQQYDIVEHSLETTLQACLYKNEKINLAERLKRTRTFLSFMPTSGISYKKDILDKVFPIPESITRICADTYVNIVALYYGANVKTLYQCLGHYRIHNSNNWHSNQERYTNIFNQFIDAVNERIAENNEPIIPSTYEAIENSLTDAQGLINKKLVIYGTGNFSEMVTDILRQQRNQILGYIVTSLSVGDDHFMNKKVYEAAHFSASDIYEQTDIIIIANSYKHEVSALLEKLNINKTLFVFDF